MFISDLDGTLLNHNAELSPYTKDALTRMIANGLHFSVATARTAETAFQILEGVPWREPLILLNGVLIYSFTQQRYVQILPLPVKVASEIISILQQLHMTRFMYQLKDNKLITYCEILDNQALHDFMEERKIRYHKVFHKASFADVPPEDTIYFTLLDTQGKVQLAQKSFSAVSDVCLSVYKDIYSPDLWYLEIHSDKATKQNGLIYLRESCGFERIIGFGDNLNDLPMFAVCDIKIAVENVNAEVKAAADYICDTNDRNGVVKWIEALHSREKWS